MMHYTRLSILRNSIPMMATRNAVRSNAWGRFLLIVARSAMLLTCSALAPGVRAADEPPNEPRQPLAGVTSKCADCAVIRAIRELRDGQIDTTTRDTMIQTSGLPSARRRRMSARCLSSG